MRLSLLYRGPLASCNYACGYCPFARQTASPEALRQDAAALERLVAWVGQRRQDQLSFLFTPWGEALIHPWYQQALVQLSRWPHVEKVAIQTNLSCRLDWLAEADPTRLALWTTFHPRAVGRLDFLAQCRTLDRLGFRYSVGVVGLKEHEANIQALRNELPAHVYLWINAFKRSPGYYDPELVAMFNAIDPLFPISLQPHPSRNCACRTGKEVVAVSGDGALRRCHFVPDIIGNLYEPDFTQALRERPCPQDDCHCHIGYVHLDYLNLNQRFGDGILERIPISILWSHVQSQIACLSA